MSENNERFEDLKDAYVLDALPVEERRSFEEYLVAHPERQAEIDELSAVAGLLAFSPHGQDPPPELRRRIMDTVEAEAAQPRIHPHSGRRSWLAGLWEAAGVRDLALAAAALLVIGLFSWSVLLQGEVQDLQGRVQSLQSQPQGPQMIALGGVGTKQGARAELVTLEGDRARGRRRGGDGRARRRLEGADHRSDAGGQGQSLGGEANRTNAPLP